MTNVRNGLRTTALTRPAPDAPKEVALMEIFKPMTRTASPRARVSLLPCATSDVRTAVCGLDVRGVLVADTTVAQRDRAAIAPISMGHTGFAGYVPGSRTWSPPS